ncbi:MAG: hypothetical protein VB124_03360 [Burkholderia sp.]
MYIGLASSSRSIYATTPRTGANQPKGCASSSDRSKLMPAADCPCE